MDYYYYYYNIYNIIIILCKNLDELGKRDTSQISHRID